MNTIWQYVRNSLDRAADEIIADQVRRLNHFRNSVMDEQSWFESSDPVAMWNYLHYSTYNEMDGYTTQSRHPPLISKRRANRFACVCSNKIEDESLQIQTMDLSPSTSMNFCQMYFMGGSSQTGLAPLWSQYLRDIVGNPFHPIVTEKQYLTDPVKKAMVVGNTLPFKNSTREYEEAILERIVRDEWLTPTVVSLAQGCYDEQERKCSRCNGDGRVWDDDPNQSIFDNYRMECPKCQGRKWIKDGSLDPDRLGILSDALEDSGCDNEIILRSLRGEVQTYDYVSLGQGDVGGLGQAIISIKTLTWKKREVPLFRGFWGTDLLLGLE